MKVWLNKDGTATAWDSSTKAYLQYNGGDFFQVLTPAESEEYVALRLMHINDNPTVVDILDDDEIEVNYR